MRSALPILCFLTLAVGGFAQTRNQAKGAAPARTQTYTAPRTADGKPDLQGIWQAMNTASFNVEPHSPAWGIRAGTGVIVDPADGLIP